MPSKSFSRHDQEKAQETQTTRQMNVSGITFEGSAELQIQLQSLDLCSEKGHMCHGTPQRTPAVVCS